jgi:hypothetical protein
VVKYHLDRGESFAAHVEQPNMQDRHWQQHQHVRDTLIQPAQSSANATAETKSILTIAVALFSTSFEIKSAGTPVMLSMQLGSVGVRVGYACLGFRRLRDPGRRLPGPPRFLWAVAAYRDNVATRVSLALCWIRAFCDVRGGFEPAGVRLGYADGVRLGCVCLCPTGDRGHCQNAGKERPRLRAARAEVSCTEIVSC